MKSHREYREALAMMLFTRNPRDKITSMIESHKRGNFKDNLMKTIRILIVMSIDKD